MTTNYKLNKLVRNCVYLLKRRFGGSITLYRLSAASTDLATGVKTQSHSSIEIDRAIVLPVKIDRDIIQSVATLSANKKMVMGGSFESGVRVFIIDRADAPGYDLTNDDWIVYKHKRYDIVSVEEFEQRKAWLVTAKVIEESTTQEDIRAYGNSYVLTLTDVAAATIE